MPAVYAHLTFGRRVLRVLPEGELKDIIQSNLPLFEIGLQGPDILFFYHPLGHHPVNRIGNELHEQSGLSFLDRQVCRQASQGQLSYLLGFICHYALDSECHSLVEYYMKRTGKGHSDIETDLERHLMTRDGLDAFRYAAAGYIRDTADNSAAIAPLYAVKPAEIKSSLISMKRIGRLLTPSNPIKHKLLTFAGQRMGKGSIVSQLTMDRVADPVYRDSNRELTARLECAVPVAAALMANFLDWYQQKDTLSQRFQPTFSFDAEELARLEERDTRV